jgi:hypothetical protein
VLTFPALPGNCTRSYSVETNSLSCYMNAHICANKDFGGQSYATGNEKSCVPLTQLYADVKSDLASFS